MFRAAMFSFNGFRTVVFCRDDGKDIQWVEQAMGCLFLKWL